MQSEFCHLEVWLTNQKQALSHAYRSQEKNDILGPLAMAVPSGLFQAVSSTPRSEGSSQAGLSSSVLCPFPALAHCVPPSCLPAPGCHGALQVPASCPWLSGFGEMQLSFAEWVNTRYLF